MIFPLDFDFLMVFFFSSAGAESEQKPVNLSVSERVVLRMREGLTSGGACLLIQRGNPVSEVSLVCRLDQKLEI